MLVVVAVAGFLPACKNARRHKQALLQQIDSLKQALFQQTGPSLADKLAGELIALYERYVRDFPDDSLSAEFLLEKANLERFLGKPREALHTLERLKHHYPEHPRVPYAYLSAALIYDEDLRMPDSARLQIEQLLEKYPDFEQREVAEQLLQLIGKPVEELFSPSDDTLQAGAR